MNYLEMVAVCTAMLVLYDRLVIIRVRRAAKHLEPRPWWKFWTNK